jgi:hypothetical protein
MGWYSCGNGRRLKPTYLRLPNHPHASHIGHSERRRVPAPGPLIDEHS